MVDVRAVLCAVDAKSTTISWCVLFFLKEIHGVYYYLRSDGPPEVGGACFLGSVFRAVPPAELQVSVPDPVSEPVAPAPVQQLPSRRQSNRLLARPSSVPVSRWATHRLIRQLDLVGQDEAIGDEAVERYERMFQHPLPRKTRAALQAVTRIAS